MSIRCALNCVHCTVQRAIAACLWFISVTEMKPDDSFDMLLVWMTVSLVFERVFTACESVALCSRYVKLVFQFFCTVSLSLS